MMAAARVSYTVGRESNKHYGETLNGVARKWNTHLHRFTVKVDPYVKPGDPKSGLLFGIDPGPWLDLAAATGVHALRGFFPALSPDGERFDLVFTVAMFYDLDAPLAAATRIAALLAPGGRWICEVADWPRCVREGIWDGICHEHLTYWTPPAMRTLAAAVGLEILAIEPTDANGGSVRYVIGQGHPQPAAAELPPPDYPAFRRAVAESIWAIRGTVLTRATQGDVVHLYGASTKGNVLLQACGLGPESLPLAAERSPHKVGTTTATGISPRRSSGTPKTEQAATEGCPAMIASTTAG